MSFTIIIPVYNVQPYITACLNSVMAQTYTQGLECLIIDDCGTDDSIRIAEQMVENYNGPIHFCIIHHEHNKGLSGARNTGIQHAKGQWLYFLDSDDWISDDCIERLAHAAEEYPDAELIQGDIISGQKWARLEGKGLPAYSSDHKWIKRKLLSYKQVPMTAWNKLVKKDFILKNDLFFMEGYIHEDELWYWKLAKHLHSIAFLFHKIYFYNEGRPEGIIDNTKKDKSIFFFKILELWVQDIDDFCKKEQISYFFEKLRRMTPAIKTEEDQQCMTQLLHTLAAQSHGIKRMALLIYANSPQKLQKKHLWGSIIAKTLKYL